MAFDPDTLIRLTTRLNQAKRLSFNDSQAALISYPDVFNAVVDEELAQEIRLLELIVHAEEGDPIVLFEERCQARALQNKGSRLSILEMPFGACNQLYFDCISIINPSATMAYYLRLLLPDAVFYVTPDYNAVPNAIELTLVKKPLDIFLGLFTQKRLSNLVQADDIIFDVKDIRTYDFKWHQNFFQRIYQEYPALAKVIYEHNSDLKTLAGYLHRISSEGQSLLEVLNQFIKDLRCGGEQITGQALASIPASIAVANFWGYIDLLPADIKNALLVFCTADNTKKLSTVLNELINFGCVETAANQLEGIITHQKSLNTSILYQIPTIPEVIYGVLREQYQQGTSVSSAREQTNSILPSYYLKQLDERLSIKEMPDIVLALLSFPIDMYSIILKNTVDNLQDETVYQLASIINTGILSVQQIKAVLDAFLLNLGEIYSDDALDLAIATSAIDTVSLLFGNKNQEERFEFLHNLEGINPYLPPLEIACRHPLILKTLIDDLTPENQLRLIQETLLLTHAAQNQETLKMIYSLYPKEVCSEVIKHDKNDTFWFLLVKNSHSLQFILSVYTAEEIMALQKSDKERAYLLYYAFKYPSSLQLILPIYPLDRLTYLILNTYDENEKTMRYHLNEIDSKKNLLSFKTLMSALSQQQKIKVILSQERNGNTLLHELVMYNDKFMDIIAYFNHKNDFFDALKIQNKGGQTVIHNLLLNNSALLQKLFELMPDMPWFSAFNEKNYFGKTLIQTILSCHLLKETIQSLLSSMPLDLRFIFLVDLDIKSRIDTLQFLHSQLSFVFPLEKATANCLDLDVLLRIPLTEATNKTQRELLIKCLTYPNSSRPLSLLLDYLLDIVSAEEIFVWASLENKSCLTPHHQLLAARCSLPLPLMMQEQVIPASTGFFWEKNRFESCLGKRDRDHIATIAAESEPQAKQSRHI